MTVPSVTETTFPRYLYLANAAMSCIGLYCALYLCNATTIFSVGITLFALGLIVLAIKSRELFGTVLPRSQPPRSTEGTSAEDDAHYSVMDELNMCLGQLDPRDQPSLKRDVQAYYDKRGYEPDIGSLLDYTANSLQQKQQDLRSTSAQLFAVWCRYPRNYSFLALALCKEGIACGAEEAKLYLERFRGSSHSQERDWPFFREQILAAQPLKSSELLRSEVDCINDWTSDLFSQSGALCDRLVRMLLPDFSRQYYDTQRDTPLFWSNIEGNAASLSDLLTLDRKEYVHLLLLESKNHDDGTHYLRLALFLFVGNSSDIERLIELAKSIPIDTLGALVASIHDRSSFAKQLYRCWLHHSIETELSLPPDVTEQLIVELDCIRHAMCTEMLSLTNDPIDKLLQEAIREHESSYSCALIFFRYSHQAPKEVAQRLLGLAWRALLSPRDRFPNGIADTSDSSLHESWLTHLFASNHKYHVSFKSWLESTFDTHSYIADVEQTFGVDFSVHLTDLWLESLVTGKTDSVRATHSLRRAFETLRHEHPRESRKCAAQLVCEHQLDDCLLSLCSPIADRFFEHVDLINEFIRKNSLDRNAVETLFANMHDKHFNPYELNEKSLKKLVQQQGLNDEAYVLSKLASICFGSDYSELGPEKLELCRWLSQHGLMDISLESVHDLFGEIRDPKKSNYAKLLLKSAFQLDGSLPKWRVMWAALPGLGFRGVTPEVLCKALEDSQWCEYGDIDRRRLFKEVLKQHKDMTGAIGGRVPALQSNTDCPELFSDYLHICDNKILQKIMRLVQQTGDAKAVQLALKVLVGVNFMQGQAMFDNHIILPVIEGVKKKILELNLDDRESPLDSHTVMQRIFAELLTLQYLPDKAYWPDYIAAVLWHNHQQTAILVKEPPPLIQAIEKWLGRREHLMPHIEYQGNSGEASCSSSLR